MDIIEHILRHCGYPVSTIVLDAESYFDKDYTLSKLSTYEYVTDKRFEIHGWAVKVDDEPSTFESEPPSVDWDDCTVIMHNASYDALVLRHHYDIHPPFIIDTLDLARHVEPRWKNSLAALCTRHKLPAKGDTDQFKGLHRADIIDTEQWRNLIAYAMNDADREFDLFKILLPKLSTPKIELAVAAWTRRLFLHPLLDFNMSKADDLQQQMIHEINEAVAATGQTEKQIRGTISFNRLIREALNGEEPPTKIGKKGRILAIAKTDPGRSVLLNHTKKSVRDLMQARIAAKSWPLHIKRIGRMRSMAEAAGGRLPVPLRYYGSHTGRWAGGGGVNLQNLPAHGNPLVNQIRSLIEAPTGQVLIISDFSQIEARMLAWLAHQDDLVRAFADGEPIYCNFASKFLGHKIRKSLPTDTEIVAKWYGRYRQLGKIGILGSGFGMGANQCQVFAKNTYGLDLTPLDAQRLISLYRRQNKRIVAYWSEVERAFRMATQIPGRKYTLPYGIQFFRDGSTTVIQLPSGRRLYYEGARVGGTTRYPHLEMPHPNRPKEMIYFWGGLLVENIVQAASRDILVHAIFQIEEKLGLKVALTVHDDMSIPVFKSKAETYLLRIEALVRIPPAWAKGLPLDVELQISKEYIK